MRNKQQDSDDLQNALKKISVPSSVADNARKEAVRQAALIELKKQNSPRSKLAWFGVPIVATGFAAIALVFSLGLFDSSAVDNSNNDSPEGVVAKLSAALSPEKVQAAAVSSLQESIQQKEQIAVQPDKYLFSKVRVGTSGPGERKQEQIIETWEDVNSGDSRTVVYDDLGNELSSVIVAAGDRHERYNFANYNQYFQRINKDQEIFPGAREIGVSSSNYEEFSMKDLDDKLEAAGLMRHYEKQYTSVDFAGYELPFEKIFANTSEQNSEIFPDEVYPEPVDSRSDYQGDTQELIMKLRDESLHLKRTEMLELLSAFDSIEIEDTVWHGEPCLGIVNTKSSSREVWYFDIQEASYLGSERVVDEIDQVSVYEVVIDEATVNEMDLDTSGHRVSAGSGEQDLVFSEPDLGLSFTLPAELKAEYFEPSNSGMEHGADFMAGPVQSYASSLGSSDCGSSAVLAEEVSIGVGEDIVTKYCELGEGGFSYSFDLGPRTIEFSSLSSDPDEQLTDENIDSILSSFEVIE